MRGLILNLWFFGKQQLCAVRGHVPVKQSRQFSNVGAFEYVRCQNCEWLGYFTQERKAA
jgi:hypothetical protein